MKRIGPPGPSAPPRQRSGAQPPATIIRDHKPKTGQFTQTAFCVPVKKEGTNTLCDTTHFQVTLSVFNATDCFMWGCPQNHQA